ncbi:MAG: protein kinase [Paucibacter sp.]|nr:protein kinase [Roseateles sp.]
MSSTPTPPLPEIGRFKLLQSLGQGAQATVWLAHDPRLEREVAVKVLRPGADPLAVEDWLDEARAVSRLAHPNIVPVFEADTQGRQSYLVFEYVPGGTLAERLRGKKVLPARDAVEIALGVLDGLEAAHAAGVIHRDLKPSNILIDAQGRARVMDFGIAARMADAGRPQRVVGTPGYISPEAARGEKPCPQMDVFACAVMLAEMLSGERLNYDPDPWRAVRRVTETDLNLPMGLAADVDDALRNIVQRGLARDITQRWPTARAFRDALSAWLHPVLNPASEGNGDNATLEFLLRRMRLKTDFPALSDAVSRIQKLSLSESESLNTMSNEILKDVALTHKLLRLVNTVQFSLVGGSVSTVSRAVALVGVAGIRNLALSLVLLERMENQGHAQVLREEFLRSLLAASLAGELSLNPRESEEAFLCAMFHNLGRMLTEFYFAEEAQQIRRMVRPEASSKAERAPPVSEAMASTQVLGISFEQLGLGVARQWGLPEVLQRSMVRPEGEPPSRLIDSPVERQRWLSRAVNDVADLILHTPSAEARSKVRAMAQRYSRGLGVSAEHFDKAADQARSRLAQMAQAMDVKIEKSSPAQRLLAPLSVSGDDSMNEHALHATQVMEPTAPLNLQEQTREQAVEILALGVQDITNAMVENFKLNELLRMVLETMYRGLQFRRIVFCLRDPKTDTLVGRFGLGEKVESVASLFKVPLKAPASGQPDLFSVVVQRGVDTMIADTGQAKIAERLPKWYLDTPARAATFIVLPMATKGAPFAMIYADKAVAGSIDLGEKELSLLRTLRNQAVMAFKQAS